MPQDTELVIEQALGDGRAGRGQAVLLSAPSGRGVSRQLELAAGLARGRGMHVARARGRPAERSLRFSVAVDLLEPLWRTSLPPALRDELAGGPARTAVALLDRGEPGAAGDGGFAMTRGLWVLASRLADQRPSGLALIIDDLHDVDAASLGLLAYGAGRLEAAAVTIIAGGRSDVAPCDPGALAAFSRTARVLVPGPLDARAGAALVGSLLPDATPRFASACVAACAGNAALLHALAAGLAARGLRGSEAESTGIGGTVPAEVALVVSERLSRLPAAAQALVRALAASDRSAMLEPAAAAAGLSPEAALTAFDALLDADVLAEPPRPAFVQPILRAAVLASLTAGQRAQLVPSAAALATGGAERLGALTTSEARVAELAANGMTTRQIAATLFVTPKTVEFHLRNVYVKLGIPSKRTALSQALEPPEAVRSAG